MKYKVGDIVRIKSAEQIERDYPKRLFEPSRRALFGQLLCVAIARPGDLNKKPCPYSPWYYFVGKRETSLTEDFIEGAVI